MSAKPLQEWTLCRSLSPVTGPVDSLVPTIEEPSLPTPTPTPALSQSPDTNFEARSTNSPVGSPATPPVPSQGIPADIMALVSARRAQISAQRRAAKNSLHALRETR